MFTQRVISSVLVPQDVYQKKPQVVLENVAANNMVGLLKQVGQLSEYAADVLKNLFDESSQTYSRIKTIGERLGYMESAVPQVESVFQSHDPAFFYAAGKSGKEWRNRDLYTQSLFSPKTQPAPVQNRRTACQAPPSVHLLDQIANKNCLLEYSNPGLFFELWFKEEEERQKKLREENKKKKKKKKARVQTNQPRVVEKIELKVFSGKGKEFDTPGQSATSSTTGTTQTPQKQSRMVTEEVDDEEEEAPTTSTSPQRPTYVYSTPSKSTLGVSQRTIQTTAQPTTTSTGTTDAYFTGGTSRDYYEQPRVVPPVPTIDGSVPTAPPVATAPIRSSGGGPVPPLTRPSPPTSAMPSPPQSAYGARPPPVEEAPPEAPPMDSDAPEAPPIDADAPEAPPDSGVPLAVGTGGGGGGGGGGSKVPPRPDVGGLLGEIAKGKTLRKAQPLAPAPASGRDGLLGEIRNRNFQLKKVEVKEKKEDKGYSGGGGGLGSVMAILSRRSAISGSSDEEDEPKGGVVTSASSSSKKDDDDDDEEESWDP